MKEKADTSIKNAIQALPLDKFTTEDKEHAEAVLKRSMKPKKVQKTPPI